MTRMRMGSQRQENIVGRVGRTGETPAPPRVASAVVAGARQRQCKVLVGAVPVDQQQRVLLAGLRLLEPGLGLLWRRYCLLVDRLDDVAGLYAERRQRAVVGDGGDDH